MIKHRTRFTPNNMIPAPLSFEWLISPLTMRCSSNYHLSCGGLIFCLPLAEHSSLASSAKEKEDVRLSGGVVLFSNWWAECGRKKNTRTPKAFEGSRPVDTRLDFPLRRPSPKFPCDVIRTKKTPLDLHWICSSSCWTPTSPKVTPA